MHLSITLYKNCILNETYQNVFSLAKRNNKTILDLYLEGLNKFTFAIFDVYYENNGEFVVDLSIFNGTTINSIYDYNYIKISQHDTLYSDAKLVRYCFVNSIKIKNDLVYLEYKEDVWHSYIDKVAGINDSYMSRTRYRSRLNLGEPIELPVEFDGNNQLTISEEIYNSLLYALVEVQLYEIVTGDNPRAYRNVKYYLVKGNSSTGYKQLATEIESLISDLEIFMTDQTLGGYNYEIGDVYIVNADFDLETKLTFDSEIQLGSTGIYFKPLKQDANSFKGIKLIEKTILNDYHNYSIGTFDNQIKIINNGTDMKVSIYMFYSTGSVVFQMRLLNQIIDITNSFKYEIPATSIRAEEYTQRKIAMDLENANLKADRDLRVSDSIQSFLSGITGLYHLNLGKGAKGIFDFVYNNPFGKWAKEGNKFENINAPQYSNAKGCFGNNSGITNYRQGIFLLKIDADNNDYVKSSINNTGYKIYHYTKSFSSLNIMTDMYNTLHYDYMKFETIDIYGSFPREIALALNEIFETGVKVWYDENLTYDTYVV